MGFTKKPFPIVWGDEGVDVSRDEFFPHVGGKLVGKRVHVGSNFKFPKGEQKPGKYQATPDMQKYICMVGKCSGVLGKKKNNEEDEE